MGDVDPDLRLAALRRELPTPTAAFANDARAVRCVGLPCASGQLSKIGDARFSVGVFRLPTSFAMEVYRMFALELTS